MSSLIVASDLDLMMLEIAIDQLIVPRVSKFDSALLKKTVVMFRLLDKDWTSFYPQRTDYHPYKGTNSETEPFHGGVSVVFSLPQSSFDVEMQKVDLQMHVHRELSKYFELQSSERVGIACIDVSHLFNGVIKGLKNRDEFLARIPIAKSCKDTYTLFNEDGTESGAKATVYLRVTHLGHSLISEIHVPDDPKRLFYAREETSENLPYQFREITMEELTSGCWGSGTLIPPTDPRDTICCCDSKELTGKSDLSNVTGPSESRDSSEPGTQGDGGNGKGKGKGKGKEKGKSKGKGKKESKKVPKSDSGEGKTGEKPPKKGQEGDGKREREGEGEEEGEGEVDDGDATAGVEGGRGGGVSCLEKPILCGREGACNKKDKKGKYGKCGRPDGEGGNPLACGERRKCSRRKMAAGSATVGIVDKKLPCPPPRATNVCLCPPARTCPTPVWSPCTATSTPCARCQPTYYASTSFTPRSKNNFCQNHDTRRYLYEGNPCQRMHVGW